MPISPSSVLDNLINAVDGYPSETPITVGLLQTILIEANASQRQDEYAEYMGEDM